MLNREVYEYNSKIYVTEDAINQAIEDEIASDYNNAEGLEDAISNEFETSVDVRDANDFELFKEWCEQEGRKPSHAESLRMFLDDYPPKQPLYTGKIYRQSDIEKVLHE